MELLQNTVTDLLVEQIRGKIIGGNFAPGQRLRLRDLADQYKVSTMPVREALRELEAEGLVNSEPRKGCVVTRLSADDLKDIYDIRATLEAMATSLAVPQVTEQILDQLTATIEQIDNHLGRIVHMVSLNYEFHMTLYKVTGRSHLCNFISTLRHRTQHYLHAYMINLGGMPPAQDEHRAIIEACRQGDAEQASEIMYEHVAKAGQGIIEYVNRENSAGEHPKSTFLRSAS